MPARINFYTTFVLYKYGYALHKREVEPKAKRKAQHVMNYCLNWVVGVYRPKLIRRERAAMKNNRLKANSWKAAKSLFRHKQSSMEWKGNEEHITEVQREIGEFMKIFPRLFEKPSDRGSRRKKKKRNYCQETEEGSGNFKHINPVAISSVAYAYQPSITIFITSIT